MNGFGGKVSQQISIEEFSEFGEAYETFSSTRRFFDDICMAIKESQKPVLLTEGVTFPPI